jgi:hypothetical protein
MRWGTSLRIVMFTAAMAGAATALAAGPGWTANSKVVKIVNTLDGSVYVRLSPDVTGCTQPSNYGPNWLSIPASRVGINRIKTDLLVAYTSDLPIALYMIDNQCTVGETILGGW